MTDEERAKLTDVAKDLRAITAVVLTQEPRAYVGAQLTVVVNALEQVLTPAPHVSAQPCGCDPGAKHRCWEWPECAYGRLVDNN